MRRSLLPVASLLVGISAYQPRLEAVTPPKPASAEPAVILTPKSSPTPHINGPKLYGCWQNAPRLSRYQTDPKRVGPLRDKDVNILPNVYFPDMKALTAYIHAKGLKAGIYTSPGPLDCAGFAGSYGHEA
jgi:hypothetical protein